VFSQYLARWNLVADGDPIVANSSRLLPVRRDGKPAMLKIAIEPEERIGGHLMSWWNGQGAAEVLAHDGEAFLIERATGTGSLARMVQEGRDDEASRIICGVVAGLHAPRTKPAPELVPLSRWFGELKPAAARHGGILASAAEAAAELLSSPQDVTILHGDIHHGNVLDFGPRGWLAIDPKGLCGERGFDYANIFCNPDQKHAMASGLWHGRPAS
jgi:streptomycin 6-kinase